MSQFFSPQGGGGYGGYGGGGGWGGGRGYVNDMEGGMNAGGWGGGMGNANVQFGPGQFPQGMFQPQGGQNQMFDPASFQKNIQDMMSQAGGAMPRNTGFVPPWLSQANPQGQMPGMAGGIRGVFGDPNVRGIFQNVQNQQGGVGQPQQPGGGFQNAPQLYQQYQNMAPGAGRDALVQQMQGSDQGGAFNQAMKGAGYSLGGGQNGNPFSYNLNQGQSAPQGTAPPGSFSAGVAALGQGNPNAQAMLNQSAGLPAGPTTSRYQGNQRLY